MTRHASRATPTMPMLLMKWSVTSSRLRPVVVGNNTIDAMAVTPPIIQVAALREIPVFSRKAAMTTSSKLIIEVMPAKTRETKNSTPRIGPTAPAWLMICGKAMKARPIPEPATSLTGLPEAVAINPRAAKTPRPARISNEEFANPTTRPDPVRSDFGLR